MSALYLLKKSGFTLAEVLITLLIIGVVASLVIPALINDIQQAEFKTGWKKAYSEIEQANRQLLIDNGGSLQNLFPTYATFINAYQPYFSYTKKCTYADNEGNCWHKSGEWFHINGSQRIADTYYGFILNNGSLLALWTVSTGCSALIGTSSYYECAKVMVDVNGWKKPNTVGKDIFSLHLLENKIVPAGIEGDWSFITSEGWSISADYLKN
jgi:prepilin-type N-terminal cleavage/methylation domain-containing protein